MRDFIFRQQASVFVLIRNRLVVFPLVANVSSDAFLMLRADGKNTISRLPMKILGPRRAVVNPTAGTGFDFLDQVRHRDGARQGKQKMDVILHRSRRQQVSTTSTDDATDITMQIVAPIIIDPAGAVFGGKDEMHEDVRKGLRHVRLIDDRRVWINPGMPPVRPVGVRNCGWAGYQGFAFGVADFRSQRDPPGDSVG